MNTTNTRLHTPDQRAEAWDGVSKLVARLRNLEYGCDDPKAYCDLVEDLIGTIRHITYNRCKKDTES